MTKRKLTGTRPALGAQPGCAPVPVDGVYKQLAAGGQLRTVPIDRILPDLQQARQSFDADALAALAASITELGVLQPPLVTGPQDGTYQLIAGERRWRAAQLAGLTQLQVIVRGATDTALAALAENLQREDLDPIDEATAYARITSEHAISISELARRLGLSRTETSNTLRLLELSSPIQQHLRERRLSRRHARILLTVPDLQRRDQLADRAAAEHWSVDQLRRAAVPPERRPPVPSGDPRAAAAVAALSRQIGCPVTVRRAGNGYRAAMTFKTTAALDAYLDQHGAGAPDRDRPSSG
ncbi:Stage 0 sporulation protein J [Paraconexibacter sp. AEG42_29]|uniref:Stage 0 sporulation protein J n=1 Tax=Paraconexibacter sp. AEG42_29 TaxID=2997339 RepID=A0AAU7AWR2_9ACTN